MFCYQCQETAKNQGCTVRGVCGKMDATANLQDLLIYTCKGIAIYAQKGMEMGDDIDRYGRFITDSLFMTVTNTNFDDDRFLIQIDHALKIRGELAEKYGGRLKVVKVNVDDNNELASRYGVMSIPTIKLFKSGSEVENFIGAQPKDAFSERLDRHL